MRGSCLCSNAPNAHCTAEHWRTAGHASVARATRPGLSKWWPRARAGRLFCLFVCFLFIFFLCERRCGSSSVLCKLCAQAQRGMGSSMNACACAGEIAGLSNDGRDTGMPSLHEVRPHTTEQYTAAPTNRPRSSAPLRRFRSLLSALTQRGVAGINAGLDVDADGARLGHLALQSLGDLLLLRVHAAADG